MLLYLLEYPFSYQTYAFKLNFDRIVHILTCKIIQVSSVYDKICEVTIQKILHSLMRNIENHWLNRDTEPLHIESIKTASMEDVSARVLKKTKNI